MKLKEWIEFNCDFITCSNYLIKVMKNGGHKTDDVLFTTVARKSVCEKFFGNLEIAKRGISIDKYPDSECPIIKILLLDDMGDNNG